MVAASSVVIAALSTSEPSQMVVSLLMRACLSSSSAITPWTSA
ncbi:MAG TPA: hypothetical protein VGA04_26295 [Streptosporangiaceae bacterium]